MQQDVRAYDSVVFAEEECKHALGEDPNNITNAHYEKYFDLVKESLLKKCGKPKDDRIRELLQDYYHLLQDKVESEHLRTDFVTFNMNLKSVSQVYTTLLLMMI